MSKYVASDEFKKYEQLAEKANEFLQKVLSEVQNGIFDKERLLKEFEELDVDIQDRVVRTAVFGRRREYSKVFPHASLGCQPSSTSDRVRGSSPCFTS